MKNNTRIFLIAAAIVICQLNSIKAQEVPLVRDTLSLDSLKKSNASTISLSKSQNLNHSIKGLVIDSITQKAVDYVTINLKTASGESLKSTLSKTDGSFIFEKVGGEKYILVLVSMGYQNKSIALNLDSTKQVWDIGKVALSKETKQLGEVVITADRPLIKQEVDRIAYDVQADPESKVETVLDMMRKVPLLSVDGEDKIKLKGGENYKILIDGRPSSLIAKNPEEVFKSMPAINIVKIEVITTPPAKYDSEGLAGIINIITNKKIPGGYNGNVGARYNLLFGPGLNATITAKHKKIGISSNGGINWRNTRYSPFSTSRYSYTTSTQFDQSGSRAFTGNFGWGSAEISYEIDTLNLLTTSFGLNSNGGSEMKGSLNSQNGLSPQNRQYYRLNNTTDYTWGGYDLGINYQLGFKRNKEQLLTASYKFNSNEEEGSTQVLVTEDANSNAPDNYGQYNKAGTDEQTIQLDYVHPFKKLSVEGGFKAILRNNFSNYGRDGIDPATGIYGPDPSKTDQFNYRQNVYGFYNSYQLKLDKWAVKAGLRLERTVIDADFITSRKELNTDYNNFIPSVSVQRKFKNLSSLNLGYTQRIQRPGIWQLNPYEDRNDKYIQSGNPDLQPVLNHNFDLSYSIAKKGSITSGLSYSFANNTVQYVQSLVADTTRATFMNIGKNKNLGANLNTNYPFTKKFSVNINARISYVWMDGFINSMLFENEGLQGNASANASYKFDKDWRASVNAGYYSPWITLQGQSNAYYYTSASFSKDFLKKKASFSASVNNPFQKWRSWRNETSTPEFNLVNDYSNFYRQFNFSINYKFGKLQDGIKKNKRGINNDDVSGGKGGGGQ